MAKIITTEELKKKIDEGGSFYLIDVLSENSFNARHIHGAKNVPDGHSPDFAERLAKITCTAKDAEIITYCASETCMASVHAAEALEKAGYTKVAHYKDGLAGWQNYGHKATF